MTKEPHHPKAVHIIRPSQSFNLKRAPPATNRAPGWPTPTKTESRKIKVASSARIAIDNHLPPQQQQHPGRSAKANKAQINLYHPPPPQPSKSQQIFSKGGRINTLVSPSRPTAFELYKPARQQQQPSQRPASIVPRPFPHSLTAPVLSSVSTPVTRNGLHHLPQPRPPIITHTNINLSRSTSPSSLSTASDHSGFASEDDPEDDHHPAQPIKDEEDGDGLVVNEARVNRKIADLEISNQSLLAVNEMLEITVRRQATQVAQLRKQLGKESPFEIKPLLLPVDNHNDDDDDSDANWEKDPLFDRMRQLMESMIQQGKASLRSKYKGRVLTQYLTDDEDEQAQIGPNEPETLPPPVPEKVRRLSLSLNNSRIQTDPVKGDRRTKSRIYVDKQSRQNKSKK